MAESCPEVAGSEAVEVPGAAVFTAETGCWTATGGAVTGCFLFIVAEVNVQAQKGGADADNDP